LWCGRVCCPFYLQKITKLIFWDESSPKDCIAVGEEINIASEGADGFIVTWVSGIFIVITQRFAADGTKSAIADALFVSKSAIPLYITLPSILVCLLAPAYFVTYFYYGKEIRRSL
jgi:hypothetical protein